MSPLHFLFSKESYSFGVPGLQSNIFSAIHWDERTVLMIPTDRWFFFSPVWLSLLSTQWVRTFNLLPPQEYRWYYWLVYDPPGSVFQWTPQWHKATKRFAPLTLTGYPIRLTESMLPVSILHAQLHYVREFSKEAFTSWLAEPPRPSSRRDVSRLWRTTPVAEPELTYQQWQEEPEFLPAAISSQWPKWSGLLGNWSPVEG